VHLAAAKRRAKVRRLQIVISDLQGLLANGGHGNGRVDVRTAGQNHRHASAARTEHQEPVLVNDLLVQRQRAGRNDILACRRPTATGNGGVQAAPRQGSTPGLGRCTAAGRDFVANDRAVRARTKLRSHLPIAVRNVSTGNVFRHVAAGGRADSEVLAAGRSPTDGDGKAPFVGDPGALREGLCSGREKGDGKD